MVLVLYAVGRGGLTNAPDEGFGIWFAEVVYFVFVGFV